MKTKFVKVVVTVSIIMMVIVGCGQKEASVSQTSVADEIVVGQIEENQVNTEEQEEVSTSEFEFEEQDGEMVLVKYNGTATSVTIPGEYNGKTVTVIGEGSFNQNQTVEEVVLPKSIVRIEQEAFMMCYALTKINISNDIEEMDVSAFSNTNIQEIVIPSKMIELSEGVFAVTSIIDVEIPSNIKIIGERAFQGCKNLTEVDIKEGAESIDYCAFGDNDALTRVNIPSSVIEIDESAFIASKKNLTITAPAGSYAEQYAAEQEITFQAQ